MPSSSSKIMNHLTRIQNRDDENTLRHVIVGVHGVGKTSLAAGAPSPAFIAPAYGVEGFNNINGWSPTTYEEFIDVLDSIIADPKPAFKTLVIDTMNWVEELAEEAVAKAHGVTSFAKIPDKYNFKKWGALAMEAPRILGKLDRIRAKGISQIILFHADTQKHTTPEGQEWLRYIPKGYKDFTPVFMQRSSSVMFFVYETFETDLGGKKQIVGDNRVLRTSWSHAYDAKNRLNLPDTIIIPPDAPYETLDREIRENSISHLAEKFTSLLATSTLSEEERAVWTKTPIESVLAHRIKAGIAKLENLQPAKK